MALNVDKERQQAHRLLDLLPPAKLGTVRSLLEVIIDDDDELTEDDRAAIQAGLSSLDRSACASMEDVLADLGVTVAEFKKMSFADDSIAKRDC
jgi:hypothetical protein